MMKSRINNRLTNQSLQQKELKNDVVFVPYNKKWGKSTITGCVPAAVSENGKGITSLDVTTSYL